MKALAAVLSLALASLFASPAAIAADAPAAGGANLSACKADAEKLCPGIEPGEGRIKACFKAHKKELSPEWMALQAKVERILEEGAKRLDALPPPAPDPRDAEIAEWRSVAAYYLGDFVDTHTAAECRAEAVRRARGER